MGCSRLEIHFDFDSSVSICKSFLSSEEAAKLLTDLILNLNYFPVCSATLFDITLTSFDTVRGSGPRFAFDCFGLSDLAS